MNTLRTFSTWLCLGGCTAASASGLNLESRAQIQGAALGGGNGEIVAYTPHHQTLASTGDTGVQLFTLNASYGFVTGGFLDYSGAFGGAGTLAGVSSVALDRQNRGFGVASLIPADNTGTPGKLAIFNHVTGSPVTAVEVGFHPDSVSFSPDGKKVFVVNEGEFKGAGDANQAPGSVTVIDLSNVTDFSNAAHIQANLTKTTIDFSAGNLAAAGLLDGVRRNDLTASAANNLEPEFASFDAASGKLLVSLQENNAVATLDVGAGQWQAVNKLGTITQTIDASDNEISSSQGRLEINDVVAGLPMPDTIATFTVGGKTYVATANEGDARPDDADQTRVRQLPAGKVDAGTEATLNLTYGNYKDRKALGQLNVSNLDGDTDGDGDIDVLTAFGTRSMSIYELDPATGVLQDADGNAANGLTPTWDSGAFESLLATLESQSDNGGGQGLHNSDGTLGSFDSRSDNKGPEPEALAFANLGGRPVLVVGLERQGGLLLFDVTDPKHPVLIDYENDALDHLLRGPESIVLLDAAESPTGQPMMIVGYETGRPGIGLYSVPEPSQFGAALGLAGLAFVAVNRARRKQA